MGRAIAIVNEKGGVGKTTSAINITAALHKHKKKVLLVDVDRQANATKGVKIDPKAPGYRHINDLFAGNYRDPHDVITVSPHGFDVIGAHSSLWQTELNMKAEHVYNLKKLLTPLVDEYDFIIVDSPPSLSYLQWNIFAFVGELIIPIKAGAWSEDGLTDTLELYKRIKSEGINPTLKINGLLPTAIYRGLFTDDMIEDVTEDYAHLLLPLAIVRTTEVDKANKMGEPLVYYDPSLPASKQYNNLAKRLINEQE
jgi:chromosome partitioning protein